MLKPQYYFLLILLLPLAIACTEGLQENTSEPLSKEQLLEMRLSRVESPLLFGLTNINDFGRWQKGWVIGKEGRVLEVDFSQPDQQGSMYTLEREELYKIMNLGTFQYQLNDKIELANNYFEMDDIPINMDLEELSGLTYFVMVEAQNDQAESATGGCNEGDNVDYSLFEIKLLSSAGLILDNKEAKETVSWLSNISNELN